MEYMSNSCLVKIRLTSYCNRKCSYCFANDYLSDATNIGEISLADMDYLLKMCSDENIDTVLWHGGEPLLHSDLDGLVRICKKYSISVRLLTNAVVDKSKVFLLADVIHSVLINCNESFTYTDAEKDSFYENVKLMQKLFGSERVILSVNIYDKNMDFSHVKDIANKIDIKEVRVDISRPSYQQRNTHVKIDGITDCFKTARRLMEDLHKSSDIHVHFDCPFPFCVLAADDLEFLSSHIKTENMGQCLTAVDITPNLDLSLCHCSAPVEKVSIKWFSNITHAWLWLNCEEEELRWNTTWQDKCKQCTHFISRKCQGGCLGYKIQSNKIGKCLLNNDTVRVKLMINVKLGIKSDGQINHIERARNAASAAAKARKPVALWSVIAFYAIRFGLCLNEQFWWD